MATPITVTAEITDVQFTTIDTNSASNEVILALVKVTLTPSQLKSKLTVSVVKSSEIEDVHTSLVKTNIKAVPSTLDIATYEANLAYLAKLKLRQAVMLQQFNEMTTLVEVTQHNIMIKNNFTIWVCVSLQITWVLFKRKFGYTCVYIKTIRISVVIICVVFV